MNILAESQKLLPNQVKYLSDTLLIASISYELGNNWRMYIKKRGNSKLGRLRRIHMAVANLQEERFATVSKNIAELSNDKSKI